MGFEETVRSIRGGIDVAQAQLLRRLAAAVADGVIVEVGSWRGRSTVALATGSHEGSDVAVYAIEPHEPFTGVFGGEFGPRDRAAFFRNMLRTKAWQQVRLVNLSSDVVAPGWRQPVGLLWIDGDHTYEGVRRDFDCWLPHLLPTAVVVLDDTLDEQGGPHRLMAELLNAGWSVQDRAGKVQALAQPAG